MKSILRVLLSGVSQIDLRGGVLIFGLILSVFSLRSDYISGADYRLFQLGSYLVQSPRGSADIGIITVPRAEVESWYNDIHTSGRLGALLSNILHSSSSSVGILLDRPLSLSKSSSEQLLETLISEVKNQSDAVRTAKELLQRREFLLEFLRDERVIIGVSGTMPAGQKPIEVNAGALQEWPAFVLERWWPATYGGALSSENITSRPQLDHYPLLKESRSHERQLVVGNVRSELYPSFFSQYLLMLEQRVNPENKLRYFWQEDVGLHYGERVLAASPQGRLLTYGQATERLAPRITTISLDEAFARGAFPTHVFIASENNAHVKGVAADLYSVLNANTVQKPWWSPLVERGLILLLTLYVCFLMPRLSMLFGVKLTVTIAVLLVIFQVLIGLVQHVYVPLMLAVAWLFCAHILISNWQSRRKKWLHLIENTDAAKFMQASIFLEKGELDQAAEALEQCRPQKNVLLKLYEVAKVYSEKRQYQSALTTLEKIERRKKDFRDVEQKILTLRAMVATQKKTLAKTAKIDSTAVQGTQPVKHPELGRYKVDEELGRGAMGVVYLGFDPRISRKVAIKTFNYKQFQPEQVDDLKSRFFREAEAAGRLNHPNIVSVFDVGEDANLAYIAMDFANGKPLSAFTTEDSLLPVFEVYRIIADVAQAVEYAHDNNIVHRDIKPGNIMYNPSPYQVKVTDFGIARLVDDSRTSTGEILGSPLYMSPEQLKGKKVTGASDIFSLGVTFYQLLTGALPFMGDNLAALTYEIIHGKHRGVRVARKDLPVSASRIINQCLQKEVGDRYGSAGELALVLKKAIRRDFPQAAKKAGYL